MPDPFLRGYSPQLVSRCPIPHLAIPVPIRQVTLIWLNCGGWKGGKGTPPVLVTFTVPFPVRLLLYYMPMHFLALGD